MTDSKCSEKIESAVRHFMQHDESHAGLPEFILHDGERCSSMFALLVQSVKGEQKKRLRLVLHKDALQDRTFEVCLCHELGHFIAMGRREYYPPWAFMSMLRHEIEADREAFRLFELASPGSPGPYEMYKEIFKAIPSKIFSLKGGMAGRLDAIKASLVAVARVACYVVYYACKKNKMRQATCGETKLQ